MEASDIARLARWLPPDTLTLPSEFSDMTGSGLFPNALKTHLGEAETVELTRQLFRKLIEGQTISMKDISSESKIISSKTTTRFLKEVQNTFDQVKPYLGDVEFDIVSPIENMIDFANEAIIFQIEVSSKINWLSCLVRLFTSTYGMSQTHVCLIFPLQEVCWSFELADWSTRSKFNAELMDGEDEDIETEICCRYGIGWHRGHNQNLPDLLSKLSGDLPWQVFLGGSTSSTLKLTDDEVKLSNQLIRTSHLEVYVHSPMIINLCRPFDDPSMKKSGSEGWHVSLLRKNLVYARRIGCRGVVVHTGNYLKMPVAVAVENMRQNIIRLLPEATEECPLLLETSAAEGTDTCWKLDDFKLLVDSIPDSRFGITFDTAHVWGAGYYPMDFLTPLIDRVKLIHYNDSKVIKGSHRDLHENIGRGFIPMEQLTSVAEMAKSRGIPMVRE